LNKKVVFMSDNYGFQVEALTKGVVDTAKAVLTKGEGSSSHTTSSKNNLPNSIVDGTGQVVGKVKNLHGRAKDSTHFIQSISNGDVTEAGKTLAGMVVSTAPNSERIKDSVENFIRKMPKGEQALEKGKTILSHGAAIPLIGIGVASIPLITGKADAKSVGEFIATSCKTGGMVLGPIASEAAANGCEYGWEKLTGVKIEGVSLISQMKEAKSDMAAKAAASQVDSFPVLPSFTPKGTKLGASYDLPTT
jgi:hypothetical protein